MTAGAWTYFWRGGTRASYVPTSGSAKLVREVRRAVVGTYTVQNRSKFAVTGLSSIGRSRPKGRQLHTRNSPQIRYLSTAGKGSKRARKFIEKVVLVQWSWCAQ